MKLRFGLDVRGYLCVIVVTFRQYEGVRGLDIFIFDSHLKLKLLNFFMIICPIPSIDYKKAVPVLVLRLLYTKVMP